MKALKTVFFPSLGRNVKFGRKRPIALGPHLKLANYLRASLPTPPAFCDYSSKALKALAQMYGNDTLSDCVISGGYHIVGVETGNAGDLFIATQNQIIKDYSAIGGYDPNDPSTDQGCDEITAVNYWQKHGFADLTKILGFLTVDPSNLTEVMQAMWLFENLLFGVELPDAWVNPMPGGSGFVWDAAGDPDPDNGHGYAGIGYNSQGVQISTWGMIGTMTWAALRKYCTSSANGQLLAMITPDQLTKGQTKAPNGVAWSQLIVDFDTMGGDVPEPAPTPPTPPAPSGAVTLTQVLAWADQGLAGRHAVITRRQAQRMVNASLTKNWPASK